jgi:hypothetical protein
MPDDFESPEGRSNHQAFLVGCRWLTDRTAGNTPHILTVENFIEIAIDQGIVEQHPDRLALIRNLVFFHLILDEIEVVIPQFELNLYFNAGHE